jgi:hypothetical protein
MRIAPVLIWQVPTRWSQARPMRFTHAFHDRSGRGSAASIPCGKYTPSLPAGHERAPTLVIVMDAHANPLRVRGIILDENESAHDDQHQEIYLSP